MTRTWSAVRLELGVPSYGKAAGTLSEKRSPGGAVAVSILRPVR